MNDHPAYYDIAVIGGGLAGLAAAILLRREGHSVILYEKEVYPFHKVCGEYVSLESLGFLQSLGLMLDDWDLPHMDTLELSSPNGKTLRQILPLGGFGISRYRLDYELAQIARTQNVVIADGTRVSDVQFAADRFTVSAENGIVHAKVCCGAFGKRSSLDVKWKRTFVQQKPNALNNFLSVKYHASLNHPRNIISLHNFKGGYCGLSAIEGDKTCICYLTTAQNLRDHGNSLQEMEKDVLSENPFLKKVFDTAEILYDKPLTISQISFDKKEQVRDHILLLGDAAGLITPLCGNGMSMALHSSRIASSWILGYLKNKIDRKQMEICYAREWNSTFSRRLRAGRIIQGIFGSRRLTNGVISLLKHFPSVTRNIIRQTHG